MLTNLNVKLRSKGAANIEEVDPYSETTQTGTSTQKQFLYYIVRQDKNCFDL